MTARQASLLLPKCGEEVETHKWNRSFCQEWVGAAGEQNEDGGRQSEMLRNKGKGVRSFTLEIVFILHKDSFASHHNTLHV